MAEHEVDKMLNAVNVKDGNNLQYLTFELGEEHYGVDILRVQEIKGWQPVTKIPRSPEHVCGVLNLRGIVVPIVDLRLFLGMPFVEYCNTTVVVVLRVLQDDGQRIVGIVVDAVSDVQDVPPGETKASPDFGNVVCTDYISGIVDNGDGMLLLLDIDKMLSSERIG
ncbi:chemotaxis protein CheW [Nitrincola sp. MINF-07-Sa-05]|uniref:chemotaxis protein CheW n=1 Tax=Nitrincola salilacus TaxID=3400273 RepID=UPI0039182E16